MQSPPPGQTPSLHHSGQSALRRFIADNQRKAGDPQPPASALAQQLGIRDTPSIDPIVTWSNSSLYLQRSFGNWRSGNSSDPQVPTAIDQARLVFHLTQGQRSFVEDAPT